MSVEKQSRKNGSKGIAGASNQPAAGLPVWKRLFDLAFVLALSPALLIVGGGVALLVKCASRGPVFFRQRRIGYKGREFICFKFRTMQAHSEAQSHQEYFRQLMNAEVPMTKLDVRCDPRLAPFGALLRATGLDELPQVINVLRGEMSFVGPRPCIPYEYEQYQPWQRRRFDAVPGLTGLWQVSGKNRTTFNQMIQLDIEYAQRLSLWLDLKIVFRTLPALWEQCLEIRAQKRRQAGAPSVGVAKSIESINI
jgi:lipopolysaccharide/colanic/teichoic acid biosynthesis glycosyltransferase